MFNGDVLRFFYPLPKFPSVSVTGEKCWLQCEHCRGHYLKHMPNMSTPRKLKEFCVNHEANGGVGLLVSGGSLIEGKVPLGPFLPVLKWVKKNTDLIVNIHTGMLTYKEAEEVAASEVDIASIDVVGDDETLQRVYGLKTNVEKYNETLLHLREGGVEYIAPHICIGLHYGKLLGEYKAIRTLKKSKPDVIVFISLIPTPNTPMENMSPPKDETILKVMKYAQEIYPKTSISLGCMHDRSNKIQLERKAIKNGINRLSMASKSTLKRAVELGYNVKILDGCCAIPKNIEEKAIRIKV